MSPALLGEAGAVGEASWGDGVLGPLGAAAAPLCGPRPPAPRPSKRSPYLFINRLLSSHLPAASPAWVWGEPAGSGGRAGTQATLSLGEAVETPGTGQRSQEMPPTGP